MQALDQVIFDEIKKLAVDPNYIKAIKNSKKKDDRPNAIDKKITSIEKQMSKLIELYSLDGVSFESLQEKINELNTKKLLLAEEKTKILLKKENELTKDQALNLISSFESILEQGSFDEIRQVITALIEKIEIDNDDLTIYWKFN